MVPAVPHPFGRHSRVCKWISFTYSLCVLSFNLLFFQPCPRVGESACGPPSDFPTAGHCIGDGVPIVTMSLSPALLCEIPLLFVVQKLFSQPLSSISRCIFGVFVGRGEFRGFLSWTLILVFIFYSLEKAKHLFCPRVFFLFLWNITYRLSNELCLETRFYE